jgi:hypothetical protein
MVAGIELGLYGLVGLELWGTRGLGCSLRLQPVRRGARQDGNRSMVALSGTPLKYFARAS